MNCLPSLQTCSTNATRRPDVNRAACDLDGLEATQSRYMTLIYGTCRFASTSLGMAARPSCRLSRPIPLTSHYAPDCGRPTRGNFAIRGDGLPTVPVVAWQAGSSPGLLWQRYEYPFVGVSRRARRVASDIRHPGVYADRVPSAARPQASLREASKTGGQELRKRKYG